MVAAPHTLAGCLSNRVQLTWTPDVCRPSAWRYQQSRGCLWCVSLQTFYNYTITQRAYCSGFSKLMLTANVQRSPSRRGPGSTSSVALSGIELI